MRGDEYATLLRGRSAEARRGLLVRFIGHHEEMAARHGRAAERPWLPIDPDMPGSE